MADYTVTLSDDEEKALDWYIANVVTPISDPKDLPDKKTLVDGAVHGFVEPKVKMMIDDQTVALDQVWTKLTSQLHWQTRREYFQRLVKRVLLTLNGL